MTRIPLASAYLCEDCQCIVACAVVCECGSRALLNLATVLNRPLVIEWGKPVEEPETGIERLP